MDDYSALSDEELNARIAALEREAKASAQDANRTDNAPLAAPESRNLGFTERHGLTAQADTGYAPSDAYGGHDLRTGSDVAKKTLGDLADFAYNATPFTRQVARANEGSVRDALTQVAQTGQLPMIDIITDFKGNGGLQAAEKEWLDTEGKKFDLYARAEKGEKDVDYSPIYARAFNAKTGRYQVEKDENGVEYLDDRYAGGAEAKELARAEYMKQFATEWLKQTEGGKDLAKQELASDTAPWYTRLGEGATESLGFAAELYMGGAAMRGLAGTGALGETAAGLARVGQAGKAGLLGWKGKTALAGLEIALPSVENAVARFEQLTADDVKFDENGNVSFIEGDGLMRGAAKAGVGAVAENAVEVALGKVVNRMLGGVARKIGGTKPMQKLLGKLPDGMVSKTRDLWFDTMKKYAKVQNALKFDLPTGEFAEEYVQGFTDNVLLGGLENKHAQKDGTWSDFNRQFLSWDAGLKDLTFGILGQTLLFGAGAHVAERGRINALSFDRRITGALKERGFSSWEQFMMGANKRLATGVLANTQREYGTDGNYELRNALLQDKAFGATARDVLKVCGIGEKRMDAMSDREVVAALDVVNAVLTNPDGAEGVLKEMNGGMQKILRNMEMKSVLDGNWKNVKGANERESRATWAGASDENGNINWVDDGENDAYVEDGATGARVYKKPMSASNGTLSYGYVAFHPELGYAQPAPTIRDALNWVSDMDKTVQERADLRQQKKEYVGNFVNRIVPKRTDKKTGTAFGANVVTVNNADDAAQSDNVPEQDRADMANLTDEEKLNQAYTSDKTGIVYVFADNVKSVDQMMYTVIHELGGHVAPRTEADAMADKENAKREKKGSTDKVSGGSLLDAIIAKVYPNAKSKNEQKAEMERKARKDSPNAERIAKEEGLAYGNEMYAPNASMFQRAKTAVKMFVNEKFGKDIQLTDDDYNAIATAGLRKIKQTVGVVGDTAKTTYSYGSDTPSAPLAFNLNDTKHGLSLAQKEMESRWVSDFARQQDALAAARLQNGAAQDKAEADARNAEAQAKEDAKIAKMVQEQDEQDAAKADAALATPANRSGVADVLNDWNADDPATNSRVVNEATKEEIDLVLDAVEAEMGGDDGALKSALDTVMADIKKRKASADAKARLAKFGNPQTKAKAERDAAEKKLVTKFAEGVQMNPNSMLAFWLSKGKRLLTQPTTTLERMQGTMVGKKGAKKPKMMGQRVRFSSANGLDSEALNQFFDGLKDKEREKWMRIIFGEGYAKASLDGSRGNANTGADMRNQEWIAFKTGAEVNDNARMMDDADYNDFLGMLNQLKDEYEQYEAWKAGDQLTAEEQADRDAIAEYEAYANAQAAAKDEYDAWRWQRDGNNVIMADGTAYTVEDDGEGGYFATDKDNGETIHIPKTGAYEEALDGQDTTVGAGAARGADTADTRRNVGERDANAAAGQDGADGKAAEAPSADTEDLALTAATPQQLAAEQQRNRERAEIQRRLDAPLKTGTGEVGQSLMDLGGAEGEDLFNRTKESPKFRRNNGIGENAYRALGPKFGAMLEIAQSDASPQVKWRRTKDAGLFHGTMDEYVAKLREDKFADGETVKSGAQSIVRRVGDKVVKFRNGDMFDAEVLANIAKHNELFPDTPYAVVGAIEEGGRQRIILEQPYIDIVPNSGTKARKQLVKQLQERFGAENVKTHGDIGERNLLKPQSWFRIDAGPWSIEDLKDLNLGIDKKDGKVKVWDSEIGYDAKKDMEGKVLGKWRRAYTTNAEAQKLADIRIQSVTDALRSAKIAQSGISDLLNAERLARELTIQGSIAPELRDIIAATKTGTVTDVAKANARAVFSLPNLSRVIEVMQDALVPMKELERRIGIAKDASVYYQFDRNYGLVAKSMDDLQRDIVEPLAKELKDNKIGQDDFRLLLMALHGAERNRMIAERSPYVLTALNDPRTAPLVQGILNGTNGSVEINDADIFNISQILGWVDKNGVRSKESKQFARDLAGSGATTAWWNERLDEYNRSGLAQKAQKAVDLVRELTRRNRQLLVDTGRISAAQAALWEKLSPNYVPLRSDMEMDANVWGKWLMGGGAEKGAGSGKRYADGEYNHAYGRGTLADNPLEFAIQQYEESLNRAYDNVARRRLADLVRQNPNLGTVFRYEPRMTASKRAHYSKAIAIIKNKVAAGTATADDLKKLNWYQEAFNADTNIPLTRVLGQNGVYHEMPTISALEGTKKKPTQIIAFKEDGNLKFIKLGGFDQADVEADPNKLDDVTAKRIATAVKKQNMAEIGGFLKFMRTATGLFSALRTAYSPTFLVSNFGADNTQASRNLYATFGGRGALQFEKYAFHALRAAKAVIGNNFDNTKIQQYAKEWYENGGKIGGLATENIKDLRKGVEQMLRRLNSQKQQLANVQSFGDMLNWIKDKGADFADFAEKWNSVVEMSTRIAAYATCRDMGYSFADAVSYSRDITVNFNRKGTATPILNALYAFSNATMQDIARSLEAFAEGDKIGGVAILGKRGAKMGFGLMMMGFLASMFGFWQDDEKDEKEGKAQWKYAKEWQKQNTLGFRIGEKVYGVPIRGLSRIPFYLGHQVYEMMTGRKNVVKAAGDTLGLAAENAFDFLGQSSSVPMSAVPSALRPVGDMMVNKTFTGRQMYREPLPGQEETAVRSEMGRKGTSDAAKAVAKALNALTGGDEKRRGLVDVQPEIVAETWNWLFGSAGKDVANIVGTGVDVATGNIGNRDLRNIPYLSRFARKLDENSADYYKARGKYEQAKAHYNGMNSLDNTDAMAEDVAENPWLSSRGSGKRWGEELQKLDGTVKQLLEIEKAVQNNDNVRKMVEEKFGLTPDRVHQLRLKTQYQFMRRLENPPTDDTDGVQAEREHKRAVAPLLRSSKREEKRWRREEKKRKKLF